METPRPARDLKRSQTVASKYWLWCCCKRLSFRAVKCCTV